MVSKTINVRNIFVVLMNGTDEARVNFGKGENLLANVRKRGEEKQERFMGNKRENPCRKGR